MHKMLARVVFLLLTVLASAVSGCQVFLADFGVYDQDLIDDPSTREISRKILVAKQDLIVEKATEDNCVVLRLARPGIHYTPTSEQYRRYGKNWVYHSKSVLEYRERNGRFPDWIPQGVVDQGTRLYVSKIEDRYRYGSGRLRKIFVTVLDGCYQGQTLHLWCFLLGADDLPDPNYFEVEGK